MPQRFLDEIGQYLPARGTVVDIGCGFGLFALYFAMRHPDLRVTGVDLNERRVACARRAAAALGLGNVTFVVGDAKHFACSEQLDGAYMLDIVHHISRRAVVRLIREISVNLAPNSRLLVKDVADRPFHKAAFTWLLDKAMNPRATVDYWAVSELAQVLREQGLTVHCHEMVDVLPYPHVLFIGVKPAAAPSAAWVAP
jgi:cyclopropane fatty-acyl-phospholipid synthase-like methyltransferase